jgi:hypothetical protein
MNASSLSSTSSDGEKFSSDGEKFSSDGEKFSSSVAGLKTRHRLFEPADVSGSESSVVKISPNSPRERWSINQSSTDTGTRKQQERWYDSHVGEWASEDGKVCANRRGERESTSEGRHETRICLSLAVSVPLIFL